MVEWQASAFVFRGWQQLRRPNTTTKADFFPLHFGEGIDYSSIFYFTAKARHLPVENMSLAAPLLLLYS
jgi:hypothetical protein